MKKIIGGIQKAFKSEKEPKVDRSKSQNELLIDIPPLKKPSSKEKIQSVQVDYDKVVTLELDSRFTKIKASPEKQTIPLMVTYKAKDVNLEHERIGLDLVMIIDVSGSMAGEKIQLVRDTLIFIIDELQERDRLCLVKFDDNSKILTNLTPMTPEFKEKFKKVVHAEIRDNGSTNIKLGLQDGFDVLLARKHINDVSAMFLLSDGQDTCGNNINTFQATLTAYDDKMKKKGMEYKINSFGYGQGHDEKILGYISNFKNGNFYYIKDLKLVDECFIECLGFLMSIFAKKAEVTIFLDGSTKFTKKHGNNWDAQGSMSKATLNIGNIALGVEKNQIAEIEVPGLSASQGNFKVGQAILTFEAQGKSYTIMKELFLVTTEAEDLGPVNSKVEENLIRVQAAETLAQAQEDYHKGDVQAAKAKMKRFKAETKQNKYIAKEYEEKIDAMMEEDLFEDEKGARQMNEILTKQAYAPGYVNLTSMNSVQKKMVAKKKS